MKFNYLFFGLLLLLFTSQAFATNVTYNYFNSSVISTMSWEYPSYGFLLGVDLNLPSVDLNKGLNSLNYINTTCRGSGADQTVFVKVKYTLIDDSNVWSSEYSKYGSAYLKFDINFQNISKNIKRIEYWGSHSSTGSPKDCKDFNFSYSNEYTGIDVDFNYNVRKDLNKIILTDTSVASDVTKTAWTWTNNGTTISTAQDYNLTATESTDYNICLHVDTNVSDINGDKCYSFNTGDWTPPVTTFSSFQVEGTTDQNITLTCTDNNSGCKTLSYRINNDSFINIDKNIFQNHYYSGPETNSDSTTWVDIRQFDLNIPQNSISLYISDLNFEIRGYTGYPVYGRLKYIYFDDSVDYSEEVTHNNTNYITYNVINKPNVSKIIKSIIIQGYCSNSTYYMRSRKLGYTSNFYYSTITKNFIYSGHGGDHNIQYFSTDNSDNNETIKTSTFTTYGTGRFNFIDENTYAPVTTTYTITPSINGVSTGTGTSVDLNLQGITNQTYTFTFSKTGYGTRYYYTDLNEFSSFDYNQLMLQDTNGNNEVDLTIYTYNGTTILPNTPITITKNNYLVGRYLTDSTGTINPFLKDQDVNYLFNVEGYYSLGQVAILFNRPKWDTNLGDIAGTWQITLTSPQSTTRYLITTNSQKIAILPNTVEDYSAKVCMYGTSNCNTDYISRTFLLSYKGNLGETLIQPYLNLVSASTLRTLKVLNYGTAQPYPDAKLEIRTKTEAGVDYLVESVITDSTGLATTYLNDGQTYYITANDVTVYNVTPNDTVTTYYIYFNYINLPSSTINPIDVNTSNDTNTLIGQVYNIRNTLFNTCTGQNDCYPAVFFSILITFLVLISVTNMTQANNPVGIKGLALVAFCSLTIFFGIGWLPVYIYAFLGAISMLLVVIVQ